MERIIYIEIKNIPVKFINIDGVSYNYYDMSEALDQLFYSDDFNRVLLTDMRIAKFLCDIKVAERTTTGSYVRGENLLKFIKEIESF